MRACDEHVCNVTCRCERVLCTCDNVCDEYDARRVAAKRELQAMPRHMTRSVRGGTSAQGCQIG